jgi:hypothetical protein
MMANAGPQGRFNRAQRAVFNYDEALPLFLSGLLLNALLGPGRFWLRGPTESLCTPRDRAGGKGSLSRRDAVAKLPRRQRPQSAHGGGLNSSLIVFTLQGNLFKNSSSDSSGV